ncbi:MAG: GTPase Era [Candidatus Accumulibacter sp.]|jgi:GTP-binding protein Era|nr:GTPase Era [Accumulibacter sp.]
MAEIKSGFIAIVGRPNVGKSTLLNCLVGEKVSIVSRKAQTTRHRITGILTRPDAQFAFVDTPGFQTKYVNALNRAINRGVKHAIADVDVIVFVVEATPFGAEDMTVLKLLPKNRPVILAVNKIDKIKYRSHLLPLLSAFSTLFPFSAIVPISAAQEKQIDDLLDEIRSYLPNEDFLFDKDEITDKNERFLAAEYVREKLFRLVGDELPYAATVEIEKFETETSLRRIGAVIVVGRSAHKGIVIGKRGGMLKRIATEARQDMEKYFGGKIFLEIFVRVQSGWNDNERLLKSLGYHE